MKKNDSLSKTSKTLGLEYLIKLSPQTYQEKTEIVYDVTLNKKNMKITQDLLLRLETTELFHFFRHFFISKLLFKT
ncbi:hypothetical protein [Mulberry dwarf phytoplasma]|uniref:hypothetical protein n=1 Tax=Mulberry dwarf phytoplasma TaxID=186171 RepID=UPI001D0FFBEB|nr:hypothetical protein [Mulberry dwarf phytoplasma]